MYGSRQTSKRHQSKVPVPSKSLRLITGIPGLSTLNDECLCKNIYICNVNSTRTKTQAGQISAGFHIVVQRTLMSSLAKLLMPSNGKPEVNPGIPDFSTLNEECQ